MFKFYYLFVRSSSSSCQNLLLFQLCASSDGVFSPRLDIKKSAESKPLCLFARDLRTKSTNHLQPADPVLQDAVALAVQHRAAHGHV